jgi:hypothetical protein
MSGHAAVVIITLDNFFVIVILREWIFERLGKRKGLEICRRLLERR